MRRFSDESAARRRLASGVGAAFLIGAVAGVAQGIARGRAGMGETRALVDWDRVYQIGSLLSGDALSRRLTRAEVDQREARYRDIVERVSPRMLIYLGEPAAGQAFVFRTRPEVMDRAAWIEANIGSFATVFEPVEDVLRARMGRSLGTPLNQQASSVMLGVMLGYLSRRVLGQYDPALLGKEAVTTGRLYFVETNLESARQHMGLPKDQFETWIVFHELTHSWQFEAHPWLRDFMNQRVRLLLTSASGKLAKIDAAELLRLAMRGELNLREPQKLLTNLMTPDQRMIFEQLQGVMSLLEGFSNHVMDALGPEMLPDYARISRQFEQRQTHKGQAERLFIRMTGLEMKMEQYRSGEKFVNEVVRQRGVAFMNKAWEGPEWLPTLAEIYAPSVWIERVAS